MSRKILKYLILFIAVILFFSLLGDEQPTRLTTVNETSTNPPIDSTIRPFLMGFTTWPPDTDATLIERNREFINTHGDITLIHQAGGVPWVEMIEKKEPQERVRNYWKYEKEHIPSSHKIFLALTPLNVDRDGLAPYAGAKDDNEPLPKSLKDERIDNSNVKEAYLRYVMLMVEQFHPDYLAIGIEVNILYNKEPDRFNEYINLHRFVYQKVKEKYPQLPVFATIQIEHLKGLTSESKGKTEDQFRVLDEIAHANDITALSIYPHLVRQKEISEDYLSIAKRFNKPIAIAESGFPSQSFHLLGFKFEGSDALQDAFLSELLKQATAEHALFVINWSGFDFEKLIDRMSLPRAVNFGTMWAFTGLADSSGNKKPALQTWEMYRALPITQES